MMYTGGDPYVPEKYSDYKNRTFTKSKDALNRILDNIKACSLKGGDKNKLILDLQQTLNTYTRL